MALSVMNFDLSPNLLLIKAEGKEGLFEVSKYRSELLAKNWKEQIKTPTVGFVERFFG
jgi:hypothetical protein